MGDVTWLRGLQGHDAVGFLEWVVVHDASDRVVDLFVVFLGWRAQRRGLASGDFGEDGYFGLVKGGALGRGERRKSEGSGGCGIRGLEDWRFKRGVLRFGY